MGYDGQMSSFRSLFSLWGRTSRSHYWLIVLALVLGLIGMLTAKNEIAAPVAVAVIVIVQLVGLIATVRRLHDAEWSRWWLALYLIPMTITWDLMHVQLGSSTWSALDVSAAIRLIPVVIGLLAPSRVSLDSITAQPA